MNITDPPSRRPVRILLVEDLPEHRELVKLQVLTFREPAVVAIEATTLADGLAFAGDRRDEYDCIVSDLGLPDAEGVEVVEKLVAVSEDRPVVVLTSRDEQGLAALRAGAQDYLVKGATDADLLERAIRHGITRQALANELTSTTKDVEHLVYSVSHDLRGPLSVANGFVGLLEEMPLSQEAAKVVAPIRRSLARLDAITMDLMEYARAVHGDLNADRVDLVNLVRSVITDQLFGDAVEIEGSLPTIRCDRRLMRHVFENIIGNGVKYAASDRPVRVVVSAVEHPIGWQINVDDNGVGMPESDRERVFDMFARGARTADVEGTGIGLAVSRRAVERHRGRIWAEDNPQGPGTRLAFVLPEEPGMLPAATSLAADEGAT